jgi:hypothetical protein
LLIVINQPLVVVIMGLYYQTITIKGMRYLKGMVYQIKHLYIVVIVGQIR